MAMASGPREMRSQEFAAGLLDAILTNGTRGGLDECRAGESEQKKQRESQPGAAQQVEPIHRFCAFQQVSWLAGDTIVIIAF